MRKIIFLAVAALIGGLLSAVHIAPSSGAGSPEGNLVSDEPAPFTPHVLDGRVFSVAQVGNTILLGGNFVASRNANATAKVNQPNLLAFNATTGRIDTGFRPAVNGSVEVVIPSGDGETAYVGGTFSTVNGETAKKLVRVRVADGSVVNSFDAGPINGKVKDLRLAGGRLWVAGAFSRINGHDQARLATLDPASGAFDPYMGREIDGVHNKGTTTVMKIDVNRAGTRLIAVGNFERLDGVRNEQFLMLDIDGGAAQPANFRTDFYEDTCSMNWSANIRDLDFSPDGSFFVVSTTGTYGSGPPSSCDTSARFETGSVGSNVQPSWVDYTGGDTQYAIEVTDSVVYIGGHARWQNNPFRRDAAGEGAVARPGIAALDPVNGLPLSWNPTRNRGVGVFDLLLTGQGLWIASDTERVAGKYHGRIALMPAGGKHLPAVSTPGLPNAVYSADGNGIDRRRLTESSVGNTVDVPSGGKNWGNVRGAFMVNGDLYTAWSTGVFDKRSFDGSTYGTTRKVDTSDRIVKLRAWYNESDDATGMFFDSGRIYYTRAGSSTLYYRYFSPESGVVGAERHIASGNVSGIDFSDVKGMFSTGSELYWATPDGNLHKMKWRNDPAHGVPVPGTASVVSGPGKDGNNWSSRALFLYQGAGGDEARAPIVSTTVRANASERRYGKPPWVVARVKSDPPATGKVRVYKGKWRLGTASVHRNGKAVVWLGKRVLRPGRHKLVVKYGGDRSHSRSSDRVWMRVRKAMPRISTHVRNKRVRVNRTHARVRVRVNATGPVRARGWVVIHDHHRRMGAAKLHNGKTTVRLKRFHSRRWHYLKVRYKATPTVRHRVVRLNVWVRP